MSRRLPTPSSYDVDVSFLMRAQTLVLSRCSSCELLWGHAGGRYVALDRFRSSVAVRRALPALPSWVMVLIVFGRRHLRRHPASLGPWVDRTRPVKYSNREGGRV